MFGHHSLQENLLLRTVPVEKAGHRKGFHRHWHFTLTGLLFLKRSNDRNKMAETWGLLNVCLMDDSSSARPRHRGGLCPWTYNFSVQELSLGSLPPLPKYPEITLSVNACSINESLVASWSENRKT